MTYFILRLDNLNSMIDLSALLLFIHKINPPIYFANEIQLPVSYSDLMQMDGYHSYFQKHNKHLKHEDFCQKNNEICIGYTLALFDISHFCNS